MRVTVEMNSSVSETFYMAEGALTAYRQVDIETKENSIVFKPKGEELKKLKGTIEQIVEDVGGPKDLAGIMTTYMYFVELNNAVRTVLDQIAPIYLASKSSDLFASNILDASEIVYKVFESLKERIEANNGNL